MTCYHPITAWRVENDTRLKFSEPHKGALEKLQVPCGRCIGCRLARSRMWATRCMHEAQLHKYNCFITLTYSDDNLPFPPSLNVEHFQKFMKRLRKKFGAKVRFFHCGEYGEKLSRPHYHAILFNCDFPDKYLFKIENGFKLYRSPLLEQLWPFGHSMIGEVTFESAAYVARYCLKKITGRDAQDYYSRYDPLTGIVYELSPEYTTMSRRPGIASGWFDRYASDVFPDDFIVVNGFKIKPPRFYDDLLKKHDPYLFDEIKFDRWERAVNSLDNTPERLQARETVQLARLSKLKRPIEELDP